MRLQTHGPGGHIAERVAIRFGGGHLRHPERAARAGDVLHDDGLPELLFHHPRQQAGRDVRAAARAERDDQRDRVFRIGGQRPGSREHERAKEEKGFFHHLADHTALLFCYRLWTGWRKPWDITASRAVPCNSGLAGQRGAGRPSRGAPSLWGMRKRRPATNRRP